MASRRQIREAVVQFLYSAYLDGASPRGEAREPFWDFITESQQRAYHVAAFRTLAHLAQGRDERLAEFITRRAPALAKLAAFPEAAPLRDDLNRLAELENAWTGAFSKLNNQPTDDPAKSTVTTLFRLGLATLFNLNQELTTTRRRFLEGLQDFPALRGPLEPVAASLRRLQNASERLRMAENPDDFPDEASLQKLRAAGEDLRNLRQRANDLVNAVLAHQTDIDHQLASVVENFSPERIDPVDRAVLRLAIYELGHTATPVKAIINEAIELARRFGTTDSHRFVNGLLDPLAKRLRE